MIRVDKSAAYNCVTAQLNTFNALSVTSFGRPFEILDESQRHTHVNSVFNDFSTRIALLKIRSWGLIALYHDLIKEKVTSLFEPTFNTEDSPYLACNENTLLFTPQ